MESISTSTPGVYIDELNPFPQNWMPVATAIPAFIGYTPKAEYQNKSYYNVAQKIASFVEFQAIYLVDNPPPPADPRQQYSPQYYLVAQDHEPKLGEYLVIEGTYYSIVPDPNTIYYLYNSVRLFYENGGGDAYIVAVGGYGAESHTPWGDPGVPIVNPNVKLADLESGLALLRNEIEPTLYICPEATLLSVTDNGTLMQGMLLQAQEMQTAICLFDVIGGAQPDPNSFMKDIQSFRDNVGSSGLMYGACYYPFINTAIMQTQDINFTNLFGGDTQQLLPLLSPASDPNPAVVQLLNQIQQPPANPLTPSQLHSALLIASPHYQQIINAVLSLVNTLPPSGGIAGVYTETDATSGVWVAPANKGILGALDLPIRLTDAQQSNLNTDAVSGKSINAIRYFNGQGILIWGARTLEGNSNDWRYITTRRTVTFIEQSIRQLARTYIREPNDANTWASIKAVITHFLTDLWSKGGLQGASSADAFQVSVGLGTTMTSDDMLNGVLRVIVSVAVVHPADFMVITCEQEQLTSG